ncbi:hypothetical protein EX30DRAFT_342823 [Ascodesmis nigricans]|uniref:Uncharacterized protein n=1 Tax=Ascodesmis nigricans TaxID=341454 RepID=A0A4S2MSI9_9PEZI|nr:hypothetical protein EX30DRAFT_342823 [Ascodesmis nigricans]
METKRSDLPAELGAYSASPDFDLEALFASTFSTTLSTLENITSGTDRLQVSANPQDTSTAPLASMGAYGLNELKISTPKTTPSTLQTQPLYAPIYAQEAVNSSVNQILNPQVFDAQGNTKYNTPWNPTANSNPSFLDNEPDMRKLSEFCGGYSVPPQGFDMNSVDPSLLSSNMPALQPESVYQNLMGQQQSAQPSQPVHHQRTNSKRSRHEFEQDDIEEEDVDSSCSEYEGSDIESSDDEYTHRKSPSGSKFKTKTKRSNKVARSTKNGHSRGPSSSRNGAGKSDVFVAPFYMPGPPIPDYMPQPYNGPPAQATATFNVPNSHNKTVSYLQYESLPDHGTHGKFRRDARGWLWNDIVFTIDDLQDFIKTHPLGKNLLFRLEKRCVYSGTRYTDMHHTTCRSKCCLASPDKRTIREGQFRIAIEEVWGRLPRKIKFTNDPFFCAGYFHVECFEHLIDIGQLIRFGMLRSFPRVEIVTEPRTSKTEPNRLCLSEKIDNCFRRFCKRLNDDPYYQGYNTNVVEKLSTQLWLTNVRKGKTSLGVKPAQLSTEMAKHLIATKAPDPGWGGSRFTGIRVAQAEAILSIGAKDKLKGSAHNVRESNRQAYQLVLEQEKIDDYSDGEEWCQVVFGVTETAKFSGAKKKPKAPKKPMAGNPGYIFPANRDMQNRAFAPMDVDTEGPQMSVKEFEELFGHPAGGFQY